MIGGLVFLYLAVTAATLFADGVMYATMDRREEKVKYARAFVRAPLWPITIWKPIFRTLADIRKDAK